MGQHATAMVAHATLLFDTAKNCVIHHPLWKHAWVEGLCDSLVERSISLGTGDGSMSEDEIG
jgi:hypothetical protein